MNMKEFFASPPPPRPTELERARMRKVLDAAPVRRRHEESDDAAALVSELRAMRSELASLRDLLSGQAPANDEILSRRQAAEMLGMSIETVSTLAREGGLPHKRVGKQYRFLRSQLMAWLAAREGGDH